MRRVTRRLTYVERDTSDSRVRWIAAAARDVVPSRLRKTCYTRIDRVLWEKTYRWYTREDIRPREHKILARMLLFDFTLRAASSRSPRYRRTFVVPPEYKPRLFPACEMCPVALIFMSRLNKKNVTLRLEVSLADIPPALITPCLLVLSMLSRRFAEFRGGSRRRCKNELTTSTFSRAPP